MAWDTDLRQLVITATGYDSTKVNWGGTPASVGYPSISLHLIDRPGSHTMDGPDVAGIRVQIDAWDTTFGGSSTVSETVLTALDGFTGGTNIKNILLDQVRSGDEEVDSTTIYRFSMDFIIWR